MPLLAQEAAQSFDDGGFAGTGHAGDADAHRLAGMGQQLLHDVLSHGKMLGRVALHHGNGAAQLHAVAFKNAGHVIVHRHFRRLGCYRGLLGQAQGVVAFGDAGHDEAGEGGILLFVFVDPFRLVDIVISGHDDLLISMLFSFTKTESRTVRFCKGREKTGAGVDPPLQIHCTQGLPRRASLCCSTGGKLIRLHPDAC